MFQVVSVVVFTHVSAQYEIKTNTNKQTMSSLFTIQQNASSEAVYFIFIKQVPSMLLNWHAHLGDNLQ